MNRSALLELFRTKAAAGQSVRLGLITPAMTADPKLAEGFDLLLLYHTSSLANPSPLAGLLPLADANQVILEWATAHPEWPKTRPIIAGLCASDPFRLQQKLLEQVRATGFVGIQNFPSMGLMDGTFRGHLEHSQMGFATEVEMIHLARELGLFTLPLAFTAADAIALFAAGADSVILHPGPKFFRPEVSEKELEESIRKLAEKIPAKSRPQPLFGLTRNFVLQPVG